LFPSIYILVSAGSLPGDFRLVGVGRRDFTDRVLRGYLADALKQFLGDSPDPKITRWLAQKTFYQNANFGDPATFGALCERI
jgi:glucose-6-phosphate 1-dehydrogenase